MLATLALTSKQICDLINILHTKAYWNAQKLQSLVFNGILIYLEVAAAYELLLSRNMFHKFETREHVS